MTQVPHVRPAHCKKMAYRIHCWAGRKKKAVARRHQSFAMCKQFPTSPTIQWLVCLTCTCPQPTWVQQTSGLETYYYSKVLQKNCNRIQSSLLFTVKQSLHCKQGPRSYQEEKRTMHCRDKGIIIRMPYLSFIYASGPRMVKATTSRSTQKTSWLIPPVNANFAITWYAP